VYNTLFMAKLSER